jgi:hypothetical protein
MDIIDINVIAENENKSKQWDCTLMFELFGLERQHDILQYAKPNPLAYAFETILKCQTTWRQLSLLLLLNSRSPNCARAHTHRQVRAL